MGWVFVPELAAPNLHLATGSDSSAMPKSSHSAKKSSELGCQPLFGMTSGHSMGNPGVDAWILSLQGSRARTLALQAIAQAWMDSEAVFFLKWQESCGKSGPISYSLKTFQGYANTLAQLKGKWPMRAMSVDGILFPLPRWVPGTYAKDGSALLPTLTASEGGYNKGGGAGRQGKERPSITTIVQKGLLPTLTASEGKHSGPSQMDSKKNFTISALVRQDDKAGMMNPAWAEWYMGFPLEWTSVKDPNASKRLETAWYQRKPAKHSCASVD